MQNSDPKSARSPSADAIACRIGQRILIARRAARLTRERLAALSDVSERYLNQLEKGEANVSIGVLGRVATALGLDLADVIADASAPPVPRIIEPLAVLLGSMTEAEQIEAHGMIERHLAARRRSYSGIALLGLRGAGKSTLARLLAERTGLPHVSVTRRIEELAGVQVNELFNLGGSEAYRNLENEAIASLVADRRFIILETAGGIVANKDAYAAVLANFRSVWLKATPEEHLSRVQSQGDMRPMRGNPRALENIRTLLAARDPDYARADHILDTSGSTVEACIATLLSLTLPILPSQRQAAS